MFAGIALRSENSYQTNYFNSPTSLPHEITLPKATLLVILVNLK